MIARLIAVLLLCLLGFGAHAQAPSQAAAVGYNTLTYGPNLIVGTNPTVTPLQSGTNWQPFNFFGTSWPGYGVTTNGNGSINIPTNTIDGFGAQISTAAFTSSPSPYIKGTAFGGGFYAEVTMSFAINSVTGGPAFWANDIESMAGGSAGDLSLRHWPGQVSNYGDWIENDIAEFDSGVPANQYGISMHNFFGPPGWFSGETFVSGTWVSANGNFYTETVATCATGSTAPSGTGSGISDGTCSWNYVSAAPSNGEISTIGSGSKITFPGGTDLTQQHKYGMLWVPATASAQGYAKYYFDGTQVGNTCTWNQYNSGLAPPPVDNSTPCGNGSAYSVMDTRHMALILGNGNTVSGQNPGPVTVYSVNVWQANANSDLGPTNPSGSGGIPIGCTTTTCTGSQLSSGFLSVSGNQFVNGLGQAQRLACAEFQGAPNDGSMTAIRAAGFNCIRLDWRDAYLSGESPAGTAVTTVGPALNASPTPGTSNSGAIIQITSGAKVSVNGVTIGNTAGVVKLYYTANSAYQFNGTNWFGPIVAGNGGASIADPTIAAPTGTVALSTGCRSNADIAACVTNANTAGLKVVFSHRGNEGPTGACVTQQANGLWFDSGTDSGGSDGCISGAGSYTYAQFKSDTVNLLTPFASNSTVVGYEMHHQPIVDGSFTAGSGPPPTGSFSTNGTNIIAPNGTTFQPRGFNIWSDDTTSSGCPGDPQLDGSYANIPTFLPKTNFVRVYGPCLRQSNLSPGSPFVTAVNYLTAHGIVVLVEDTHDTGTTPTGAELTSLENFATAIATDFKGNSAVWFESANEPSSGDSTNVAAEMVGIYNAVRAVDPTKIVVFNGTLNLAIPSSTFSSMTNVVWDQHYYNWETQFSSCGVQYSTNATCIQQQIQNDKNMITAFWSGPYAIFEYGESTSGQPPLNNGDTLGGGIMLRQVWSNSTSGNIAGDAYFQWYSDGVPSAVNNDSIFASAPGAASGDFLGDTTTTCTATGTGTTSGCGAIEAQWIAGGQGPFSASGGGGGGGGGGAVLTDGVNLTQAQVNTIVSNIQSTMLSEVPGGECFSGTCFPLTGLIGDSLVTTAVGTINTVNQTLTDSAGTTWTLHPNQSCQGNPPDWWWAGLDENGTFVYCGYIMDMRLANNGDVWIEEAKEGGWWDATAHGSGCTGCTNLIPFFQGDPGPGPNNVSSGGGGAGLPPVSWGGGGPTDVLAACEDVGATVAAVNTGVIEFCPGPLNNGSTTGNLLNGATKPTAGGNGLSDLSNAVAHPVTGTGLAGKVAYSIDIYPSNLGGVSPDSPAATVAPIWNAYFGSAMSSLPVMDMETGCSCDGTTGNLADDNAMMTAWTAWANGQVSGGPTFTTSQQPISNVWLAWGNYPGVNPDGTLNTNGTLKVGQQTWWSTLLFGTVAPPPPPPTTAWNPSDLSGVTLSVNNTVATSSTTGGEGVRSTASRATGNSVCWAEQASGTITTDWAAGLANSSANLSTSGGLGGDTTAIVIDPNSLGGLQSIFFNNVASNVAGATASANGDTIMMCANLTTDLFYATDAAMVAHFGAGAWNSSASCNPTVAGCGVSFSGMTGPFFILYNNDQSGSASTILTTAAQMPYAIPSGYVAWDTAAVAGSGRPMGVVIMGENDNHRPASNDNAIRIALNNRSMRR